ncbi:TIP41-like protein [Lycorma delicatula]|uniref:TIP41-like protein n=1 Tax=Lycorma delicatula TaxID=130591 RepID=UPI003F5148CE
MVMTSTGVNVNKLPVSEEEHSFGTWQVKYKQSHILHSKCTETSSENGCPIEGSDKLCIFCKFSKEVSLPHLPDMVFPNNLLILKHKSGATIEFNAMDALKKVQHGKMNLKIACSSEWKEARQDTGLVDNEIGSFDWTFSTDYCGTLSGEWVMQNCPDVSINWDRLKQKDKILFFHELTLFEDELHDNGISVLNVKIRVMEWGFFLLLRYFLRVDGVMIRANDTRFYHEFDADYIVREITTREAKISELNIPPTAMADQNSLVPEIPLRRTVIEKLVLKK